MTTRIWVGAALAAGLAMASPARAHDPWEFTSGGDDGSSSKLSIGTGSVQVHDLDQTGGANDVDWVGVPTLARHSYEARISNTAVIFDWGACHTCAQFERVNASGTILTDDVATVNEGTGSTTEPYDRSIRWVASSNALDEFVRVTGSQAPEDANHVYTLRYWDTTCVIPRWSNSATLTTVFFITNLTQATANATIYFYDQFGVQLHSYTFSLAQNASLSLNTAGFSALVNRSGHAHIAHTAGYGGLAGKAVGIEPSTGFLYDTEMTPFPQ